MQYGIKRDNSACSVPPWFLFSLAPASLSLSLSFNQKWVSYSRQAVSLLKEELRLLISTILMTHIHSCHSNWPYSLNSPQPHLIFATHCFSACPTTAIIEKWKQESGREWVSGRDVAEGAYLRLNEPSSSEKSNTSSQSPVHKFSVFFYKPKSTFFHLACSHNSFLIHAATDALTHMPPNQAKHITKAAALNQMSDICIK